MSTNLMDQNPGATAAKNITNLINSMAEANKAQTDLKKEIILHQIQQKMDLQKNAAELHQKNVSGIEGQNMQMDWMKNFGGAESPAASTTNGLGPSGIADGGTPTEVGSNPMASMMSPAQSPQPVVQPTPMLNASSDAQIKPNPVLNSPAPGLNGESITPQPIKPSAQYQNLGYQPVEAKQILQERQKNGQAPNMADVNYVQSLNKVKNGTASPGEVSTVHTMNNRDESGQPTQSALQQGLRNYEKQAGWPEGSAMYNPAAQPGEMPIKINPVWQSKQEAQNKLEMDRPDKYAARAEQDLMRVFSYKSAALGVQDAKIGQAMHIKQLFDQSYDPKTGVYNLKGPQFAEATQGLAVLVSNSNQTSEGQRQEIKQRTAAGDFNGALTYAFGIPKNATSQQIAKMYIDAVDRQGETAQYIKETDLSEIQKLDSFNQLKRYDPDRAKNLYKANFGIDYREFINKPWAERIKMITGKDPNESGNQVGSGGNASYKVGDTRVIGGKTVTRDANGNWS